jgi:hypothetical protein
MGVIAFTEAIIVAGSIVALHCDLRWRNKKTAEIREDVIVTIYPYQDLTWWCTTYVLGAVPRFPTFWVMGWVTTSLNLHAIFDL